MSESENPKIITQRSTARQRKKRYYTGFTLLELIIALFIVGTLSAIAIPAYQEYKETARIAVAIEDLRTIETAINAFVVLNLGLPLSLADVPQGNILDPWGRPYQYLKIQGDKRALGRARKDQFLVPLNSDFDLYSLGKDGRSVPALTGASSWDDVLRANDGGFRGLASNF